MLEDLKDILVSMRLLEEILRGRLSEKMVKAHKPQQVVDLCELGKGTAKPGCRPPSLGGTRPVLPEAVQLVGRTV